MRSTTEDTQSGLDSLPLNIELTLGRFLRVDFRDLRPSQSDEKAILYGKSAKLENVLLEQKDIHRRLLLWGGVLGFALRDRNFNPVDFATGDQKKNIYEDCESVFSLVSNPQYTQLGADLIYKMLTSYSGNYYFEENRLKRELKVQCDALKRSEQNLARLRAIEISFETIGEISTAMPAEDTQPGAIPGKPLRTTTKPYGAFVGPVPATPETAQDTRVQTPVPNPVPSPRKPLSGGYDSLGEKGNNYKTGPVSIPPREIPRKTEEPKDDFLRTPIPGALVFDDDKTPISGVTAEMVASLRRAGKQTEPKEIDVEKFLVRDEPVAEVAKPTFEPSIDELVEVPEDIQPIRSRTSTPIVYQMRPMKPSRPVRRVRAEKRGKWFRRTAAVFGALAVAGLSMFGIGSAKKQKNETQAFANAPEIAEVDTSYQSVPEQDFMQVVPNAEPVTEPVIDLVEDIDEIPELPQYLLVEIDEEPTASTEQVESPTVNHGLTLAQFASTHNFESRQSGQGLWSYIDSVARSSNSYNANIVRIKMHEYDNTYGSIVAMTYSDIQLERERNLNNPNANLVLDLVEARLNSGRPIHRV